MMELVDVTALEAVVYNVWVRFPLSTPSINFKGTKNMNPNKLFIEDEAIVVETHLDCGDYIGCVELIPDIRNIKVVESKQKSNKHNNAGSITKTVIAEFVDGTTTKAVTAPDDVFSLETGIGICLTKRILDELDVSGHSVYNRLVEYAMTKVDADKKLAEKQ